MITQFQVMDVVGMWFQQYRTTYRTARETIKLLNDTFPGYVISCFGD